MQRLKIKQFNYKDVGGIERLLYKYQGARDYKYLFSSKEWLLAFLEVYKPEQNFLVQSENSKNYFLLSKIDKELVFTGDPFNDFNGAFVFDEDKYNLKEIVSYFSYLGYKLKWESLFGSSFCQQLSKIGKICEGTIGLKITKDYDLQNYDDLISKRIRKMYNKLSENLLFFRIFGAGINHNLAIFRNLLSTRREKLLRKKRDNYNLSFEKEFELFIAKVISFPSIWSNVFVDYCTDKKKEVILASSLNFIKDKKVICYLRSHSPESGSISYGLILDYWSNRKNFKEGIKVIDLTRGNELYKYRLGAREYKLSRFVMG